MRRCANQSHQSYMPSFRRQRVIFSDCQLHLHNHLTCSSYFFYSTRKLILTLQRSRCWQPKLRRNTYCRITTLHQVGLQWFTEATCSLVRWIFGYWRFSKNRFLSHLTRFSFNFPRNWFISHKRVFRRRFGRLRRLFDHWNIIHRLSSRGIWAETREKRSNSGRI